MEKFEFLIGDWDLEYRIPNSSISEKKTGKGSGTFKRALKDKYVIFDYESHVGDEKSGAHGIFAWDEKAKIYRYWRFENSGIFLKATCKFINEDTLFMNWHHAVFIQTFKKFNRDKVILQMKNPDSNGDYELILEVILSRK